METTNKERWEKLAADVQRYNAKLDIKSLREFMRLSHLLDKYLDLELGGFGLNRTQRRIVIFILSKNAPMTPTELSKLSLLTIDTINKSVDNLDKMGVTRSYRSKKDRRVRRVVLTNAGLDMLEKMIPHRNRAFAEVMGCFDTEEINTFYAYIQRFIGQIDRLSKLDEAMGG